MLNMRESWTDERLDDFAKHVDDRFDQVDHRFDEVDRRFGEAYRRFDEVDRRFGEVDKRLGRLEDGFAGLQRTIVHGFIAMAAVVIASNAALVALFATQL